MLADGWLWGCSRIRWWWEDILLPVRVDQVQTLSTSTDLEGFVGVRVLHEVSGSLQFSAVLPELRQTANSVNVRNHSITEWFGLEGTLKIVWFQPPCHEQGHLPPAQGAQSSIQPGLERCQGGGSHSFSGQPGPGFHHPHGEEFLPNISSQSALLQFRAVPPCPITTHPCEKPLSILPVAPPGTGRLL